MITNFIQQNPTKLVFGKKQIKHLKTLIKPYKRILLVYGGGSIKQNGVYDDVMKQLKGKEVIEYSGIQPNPRLQSAKEAIQVIKENNIDFILAVGGGSVIDCVKLISVGVYYDNDPWDIVIHQAIPKKALPFATVLTLSATGSEMNCGSVITNEQTQEKLAWGSPLVYPQFSILDPCYTYSVSKAQTINGIVDTISHLIEQYINKEHNPLNDAMIEGLIKTVMNYSYKVLKNPKNYEARSVLMLASTIALNHSLSWGSNNDWGGHDIEHAISAIHDIAHGVGLSIVMPNFLKLHAKKNTKRIKQLMVNLFKINDSSFSDYEVAIMGCNKLQDYFKDIGAITTLKEVNITNSSKIAKLAHKHNVGSVYPLSYEEIYEVLQMAK